jgi:hypothetical protein
MKRMLVLPLVMWMAWCLGCGRQEASPAPAPADAVGPQKPATPSETVAAVPAAATAPKAEPEPEPEPPAEVKEVELGPPLVENPEQLRRLDPKFPVFINAQKKQVVLVGQVCQRRVPLELFACLKNTKEHEAIITIPTKAMIVHAALLAVGAEPGEPAHFDPFTPAHGQEIAIEVVWRDAKGQVQRAPAQEWVKNSATGKALTQPWIFAGSGFWTDPSNGEKHYQAESGDLICVSNFSSATLDIAMQSSSANDALVFEAFTERIPPKGTQVTVLLTPQPRMR